MKPRPVALALALALCPAALVLPPLGSVCRADGSEDDATTSMARARFKEGVEYYDKGQFDLARAAFLQAYALKKHPAVLLNLAWSCLKSGHVLEGERYFKQFLSEGGEITDKQRADASDGLNQARAKLGHVEVAAAPPGTEVSVDAESAIATPLAAPIDVEPGTHSVKMRAPDGTTDTESVTVAAGEKAVVRFSKPAAAAPGATPAPSPAPLPEAAQAPKTAEPPPVMHAPEAAVHAPGAASSEVTEAHHLPIYPIIIGSVVTVASAGLAIGMKFAKDSAQSNADSTGQQISNYEAQHGITPARCSSSASMPPLPSNVVSACSVWNSDNKQVNEDATVGNIAIATGAVALAFTAAYGIAVAIVNHRPAQSATGPTLVPMVGPSVGGLAFHATF